MMGYATVDLRYTTVHKVYPAEHRHKAAREISFYELLPWATPKLLWHGEGWLETERLIPILELPRETSAKYKQPLRDLIKAVNEAGYWHCDVSLVNVVVHPARGPLLIDWENAQRATDAVSYDLYGARAAGAEVEYEPHMPDGVWWGGPWPQCPGEYWP